MRRKSDPSEEEGSITALTLAMNWSKHLRSGTVSAWGSALILSATLLGNPATASDHVTISTERFDDISAADAGRKTAYANETSHGMQDANMRGTDLAILTTPAMEKLSNVGKEREDIAEGRTPPTRTQFVEKMDISSAVKSYHFQPELLSQPKLSGPLLDEAFREESILAQQEDARLLGLSREMMSFTIPPTTAPTVARGTGSPSADGGDCLMGRTTSEYLVDRLSLITAPDVLLDSASPQNMALQFLESDLYVIGNICNSSTLDQRYGLVTFYFSTNGAEWTDSVGWLTESSECEWFGIACNSDGLVDEFAMRKWKLSHFFTVARSGLPI
jgi:hypothetical protein